MRNVRIAMMGIADTALRFSDVEAAPANRQMDMTAIANVMLFAPQPALTNDFYVSRIWLN